jgi:zinc and cadmium transporter
VFPLLSAVGLSIAGSLGGLLAAALLLLLPPSTQTRLVPPLVSYAVGTLLGVALMALLPEAIAQAPVTQVFGTLLVGILVFFILEKALIWRHCHSEACEVHGSSGAIVLIGGAVHNFIDGAMIGASLMTSFSLGVSAAVAVAAHEVPHELGDFAVLLHTGDRRQRALLLNILTAFASVAGATGAVLLVNVMPGVLPYLLSLAASSFLYVALSDLVPDLHNRGPTGATALRQIVLVGLGMATAFLL